MPKRLKQLSTEVIAENPYWKYKHDTYTLPNGAIGDYYYADGSASVLAVPILPDGRIVMTVQYRYLFEKQSIEFPSGGVHAGEAVIDAVRRELLEETGYAADHFFSLGTVAEANGLLKISEHVFLAQVETQHGQRLSPEEEIEVVTRRPDEIDEMIRRNDIWCARTMAAWGLARNYFTGERPQEVLPGFETIIDYFS